MGDDGLLVVAVAPLKRVDEAQPLLECRQRGGVVVDRVGEAAHLVGGVLELGLQAGEAVDQWFEAGVHPCQVRTSRTATAVTSRAPLPSPTSASRNVAAPRAVPRRAAPPRAAPGARPPPGLEPRGGDLRGLVLEQLEPSCQLARLDRQLGERRPVRPPALDRGGHLATKLLVSAERIEQVALPALVEQALLLVLAVDLDERPDLLGQPRSGHGLVVEPSRRAAAGRDLADRDDRLGDRSKSASTRRAPRRA